MMNCEIIRDLLPLYTDQLTSPQSNQLIEAHIQSCPECTKLLAQLQAPIESPPADDTDYVKALRKQLQKRRLRTLLICLLVPAAILLLWWIHVQTHFAEYSTKIDSTNPAFILKKEPRVELTREEIELARQLFSDPIIRDAFLKEEAVQLSPSLLEDILSKYLPETDVISEITVLEDYVIISYHQKETRFMLEYSDPDHTGFVDAIQKTVATPRENGEVKYVYVSTFQTATGDTEYERWVTSRSWFAFPDDP